MSDPAPSAAFPPVDYGSWRARVDAELGAEADGRLARETLEGLTVEPLYAADHLPDGVPLPRMPLPPGAWRIWQEVAVSAGARGRAALGREGSRGLGGIWVRVDDETVTATRLAALIDGWPAGDDVELAIEWAGEPAAGAAMLVAAAKASGVPPERLGGCLGCDPLGALARRGTLAGSAGEQLVGAARWALDHAPGVRAGLVSTAPYADAGADAAQEIAFALASGAEALRRLVAGGLTAEAAASQLLLSVSVGRDLYLQVAKLRAMRLAWGMLLTGAGAPLSTLRLHARTGWRTKGRRDPGTDLVRATLETLAAVLAGCDDVACAPLLDAEEALALGMPLGSATQLLMLEEVGLDRVADLLGGSWYVEALTAALARRAWELFTGIERRGGMPRELAIGSIARMVDEAAERRRCALAEGRLPIVGVTVQRAPHEARLPHRPLPAPPANPLAAGDAVAEPASLVGNADSGELFAAAIDAAERGATLAGLAAAMPLGESALRAPSLRPWRDAEAFEAAETAS